MPDEKLRGEKKKRPPASADLVCIDRKDNLAGPYNYDTFHRHMMQEDMHFRGGPAPGESAPDFDLPMTSGGQFHLHEYAGRRPVLIEFGSIT